MALRRITWLSLGLAAVCWVSAAVAQPAPTEIKLPVAQRAFKTAQQLFAKNRTARANYLPRRFSLPEVGDEVLIQFLMSNGESEVTRLNTVKNSMIDLGRSLRWMTDRQNLVRIYKIIYPRVPAKFRRGLLKPKQINTLPLEEVKKAYLKLVRKIDLNIDTIIDLLRPGLPGLLTVNPIDECSTEVGYEIEGSESELSDRCEVSEYDAAGLFANIEFPLKDNLTCIKSQGARGTCVAQAIAATVETLAILDGDPAENLSEQHIYYRGETEGDAQISVVDMQMNGLATTITLDALDAGNWGIFYESGWNYNRSLGMGAITFNPAQAVFTYPNSCDGNYTGEECSDYSWQSISTVPLIALPSPGAPPVIPPPAIHTILSNSYLPCDAVGGVVTVSTLNTAILLLAGDVPMIISMQVTNAFKNTTNGYVLNAANDPVAGGHSMELIAFVPNSSLPVGAPAATEEGYFIVKNSWGITAGDCGFYYLDYGYVKDHISYISVISTS